MAFDDSQEENMELKKLKDQLGEPLCWSDYLSLPFTQTVITETLRMRNIIIGAMRKAVKNVEIKGIKTRAVAISLLLEREKGFALALTWPGWKLLSSYTTFVTQFR
ncbi:Cytochrome P450 [Sesbania bispinosa]|nr:Cytochrome P450 [Sesbania bispinosa]